MGKFMPHIYEATVGYALTMSQLENSDRRTVDLTTVYDCIGANVATVKPPPGVLMAGYATGSAGVPWTDAQFAAHPGAVRFDQSPVDTPADETADVLDVELQAATIADIPAWVHGAWQSYQAGRRPGQRKPTMYVEESELTPAANALNAAGITSGVNIWLTAPMPEHAAIELVTNAGGPFPIIGVQYGFGNDHDVSIVSTAWLNDVSKPPKSSGPAAGTQTGWAFCHKCQGLFWRAGEAQSVCPRGSTHDGTGSHTYTLGFTQ